MSRINLSFADLSNLRKYNLSKSYQPLLKNYPIFLLITLVLAFLLSGVWDNNLKFLHTFLEMSGVFVVLSIFFVVWFSYDLTPLPNRMLGFGFLTTAAYYLLHTYYFYYGAHEIGTGLKINLALAFYLLARLLEAVIILTLSWEKKVFPINKKDCLILTVVLAVAVPILLINYSQLLPLLVNDEGVTPFKNSIELLLITLFALSLYNLKFRKSRPFNFTYQHIFFALLFSIPAELNFMLYQNSYPFFKIWGHLLKIPYYVYLFRAIFISSITYPYQRLKKSNLYITDLFNKLPLGLINFTTDYRLSFANNTALDLLECSLESIQGLNREQLTARLLPDKKNNQLDNINFMADIITIKTCQGNLKKLQIYNYRLENDEYIWIFNEATKEQKLNNLQLQTETILNSITNLVLLVDNNNRIVMYNKALQETMELDNRQLKGTDVRSLNQLFSLNMEEIHRKILRGENDEENHYEVSCKTARGRAKDLLVHSAPITNVEGEIIGVIYIASDITDLKKEQQKLIQQEKLALLGQLGASIVHETKNYLATIKGSSQLLNILNDQEKIKKYARTIDQATDEVSRIINHFLSLSRPRQPEFTEVSLNDLLETMDNMIKTPSLINGIEINFNLTAEEKKVCCDENQLKQVILNVWQNAVDAVAEVKKPVIKISTELNKSKKEMVLSISDNGRGINSEEQEKIGTPFYTTKNKGTGLGLSVCFQIMKDNGGRIEFTSKPGAGTTFFIFLPVLDT